MYKLTIVSGPQRGSSYPLQEGENTIGRMNGNTVVVQSARVSKRHCSIQIENGVITLKDLGSSNGTFLNGVLTRSKAIKSGDRVSVGEYIFQFDSFSARPPQSAPVARLSHINHNPMPSSIPMQNHGMIPPNPMMMGVPQPAQQVAAPKTLQEKANFFFDHSVMPFFYALLLKNEWRMLGSGIFGAMVIAIVIASVYPLIASQNNALMNEAGKRAQHIARQMAEMNTIAIATLATTKTDIGIADKGAGVRVAVLTDIDGRILAPAHRHGNYLNQGQEAIFLINMRREFEKGKETGRFIPLDGSTVAAIEPVKVYDSRIGKNVVRAIALVSIDVTQSLPGSGDTGIVYSQTLILAGSVAIFFLLILYKLTLRPFVVLNDDMDKVLKGELPQVTHEYKMSEMNELWDIINSALQRMPKGGSSLSASAGVVGPAAEDFSGAAHLLGDLGKFGVILCDSERKIMYLNNLFEEISGIRADGAVGHTFTDVGRDQSLGVLTNDLMDRASGGDIVTDDCDFSGLFYKLQVVAFGARTGQAKGFLLLVVKPEE